MADIRRIEEQVQRELDEVDLDIFEFTFFGDNRSIQRFIRSL